MKRFLMTFAAMLLVSVGAFAQSGTPLKGDVNEDGVVDFADINAVIAIMKNGGGTGEGTKYYWYVGQTDPSTMTTISPVVSDTTSPGWRLIGTTLPTYSASNKLYDTVARQADNSFIVTGTSLATQWVALPANCSACVRDGAGNDGTTVNICTQKSNVTIGGITYKVYEWNGKAKKLGYDIY